jgi:dipeptidyl aminopeptidase/acylaminoacyl peptidase
MRDVPAARLAYSFETDATPPADATSDNATDKLAAVQADFDARRKEEALIRTVLSPDGQRALALYETGDVQTGEYRIDIYAANGTFLRNLTSTELSGAFAPMVAWSPDGNEIAFIGRKGLTSKPSPTPLDVLPPIVDPNAPPLPTPSVAPAFAPVQVFNTEQIYVCDRDGFSLRPLTTREGLIYFALAWSPDSHALAALACREEEWDAREKDFKPPVGRPRLIGMDARERLLDDALADAAPVWSPDSSKVAAAFETDVRIYDAVATDSPTQANIALRDSLINASAAFDEKNLSRNKAPTNANGQNKEFAKTHTSSTPGTPASQSEPPAPARLPVSFNSIVRLEWPDDGKLYLETAYVRTTQPPVNNFPRWHILNLSAQAALLKSE